MLKYSFLVVLAFMLVSTTVLDAQGLYLGPRLGYFKSSDADNGTFMGGAALRAKISPSFGIEGSINYRQETYNNGHLVVKSWPVMVTAMIYPVPVAYGLIGAGWYNSSATYDPTFFSGSSESSSQDVGWHFGGGLELPSGTNIFTADVRYVFLNYDFTAVPGSSAISANFYVLTLGYSFSL